MANRIKRRNISDERMEDSTLYGEFISSFDRWITPDRQRNAARHLEEIADISTDDSKLKNSKKRSN